MEVVRVFVMMMAVMFSAVPAAVRADVLRTSNGHEITATPAATMTCEQIEAHLVRIDATGYRSDGPLPTNDADGALYDYERALSVAFYWRCVARVDSAAHDDAFSSGYSEK